jgi:hypothetical protein
VFDLDLQTLGPNHGESCFRYVTSILASSMFIKHGQAPFPPALPLLTERSRVRARNPLSHHLVVVMDWLKKPLSRNLMLARGIETSTFGLIEAKYKKTVPHHLVVVMDWL